jgi:hypothetical protein
MDCCQADRIGAAHCTTDLIDYVDFVIVTSATCRRGAGQAGGGCAQVNGLARATFTWDQALSGAARLRAFSRVGAAIGSGWTPAGGGCSVVNLPTSLPFT